MQSNQPFVYKRAIGQIILMPFAVRHPEAMLKPFAQAFDIHAIRKRNEHRSIAF